MKAVGFVPGDGQKGRWLRSGRRPRGPLASFRTTATRAVGFVPDDGHEGRWLRSGRRPSRARSGGNHAGHALDRHATRPRVCQDNPWGRSQPADLRRVFPGSISKTAGSIQTRGICHNGSWLRSGRRPLALRTMPEAGGNFGPPRTGLGPLGDLGNLGGILDGFRIRTLNPGSANSSVSSYQRAARDLVPPPVI